VTEPVTVVVRRKAKPRREADYEAWLSRLTEAARHKAPGYLGAEFHKPAQAGGEYKSVFRFDSLANLEAFEKSRLRARMLEEVAPFVEGDAAWERMTGLEVWFTPPAGTIVPQPSPHRMVIVLVAVVFSLVLILNLALGPFIADWPLTLRLLLTVAIQVGLMTYVIMPRLTPLIARFIYPKSRTL
jgi:antibiotic biosynthesis monooxygenase (ABM) superfamily enzyme